MQDVDAGGFSDRLICRGNLSYYEETWCIINGLYVVL